MNLNIHRWFAVLGVILFGLFLAILVKEMRRDWVGPQKRYVEILRRQSLAQGNHERIAMPGIQQLTLEDLNRIDRCTTCHLGVDDSTFRDASQPLTTHPRSYLKWHPVEEFGCTACHGGQGMATSFREAAHKEISHWDDPILPLAYTEANCGTCHTSRDVPAAPLLSEGRRLIARGNCTGCHEIPGYHEGEVWGTPYGSELNDTGFKVNRNWLLLWLKDPHAYLNQPRMPQFNLSDEETRAVATFLLSQKKRNIETLPADFEKRGDADRGHTLVGQSRCISCHSFSGKGGNLAPDLGKVLSKVNPDWLYSFLKNPHYYSSHTQMLQYNFTEQDVLDIVAYMKSELSDPDFPKAPDALLQEPTPEEEAKLLPEGKKIFLERGCLGCHAIEGLSDPGRIGPSLAFVGSRTTDTLEFGKVQGVQRDLSNWLFGKLKNPRMYEAKAKMPDYHFTDEEAARVTVALMSLKEVHYAPEQMVPVEGSPRGVFNPVGGPFNPQGDFGQLFTKFRCFSCHQVYGRGGTLSTVSLDREGVQVKREWLISYLQNPYAIRPQVIERMPLFKMTAEEATLLANYIESVFVDDKVPMVDEQTFTDGERAQGQYLFDKYGCQGCHIHGQKEGGYVGPDLTMAGDRLRAGWLMEWLRHPLRYRPETIHPDYRLDEQETRALTAYVLSLKEGKKP